MTSQPRSLSLFATYSGARVRLIWLVRFVATRPSILYIPPQCHQSRMEVIGTRVVSPIIIHNSTVYGLRLHPSSRDRGPVGGKPVAATAVRTKRRRLYGRAVGVTSSLSRYARSWESTWEPCSGSAEEAEGAFFDGCQDSSACRLRRAKIEGRFQPPRRGSQVPIPKRRLPSRSLSR